MRLLPFWLSCAACAVAGAAGPAHAPHPPPLHDPIASAQELISRVMGEAYVPAIALAVIPPDAATGNDVFELDGPPLAIRGNSGVALAAGLGWWLKFTLNASWGWGYSNSGNNIIAMLPPPAALPAPATPGRFVSPARFRYSWNTCTFGYSFPYYTAADWQDEVDRIALWGINAPLLPIGVEAVELDVYTAMGVRPEEMQAYWTGHSHLPWNRMANIKGLGGPLPLLAVEAQRALGQAVAGMMLTLGMTPVLNGFAGHIPDAVRRVHPEANISSASDWGGVGCNVSCVALLEPSDPLFSTLGAALNARALDLFGGGAAATAPMFNADTFNEEKPSSGDDTYLASWNSAVYGAMVAAHAESIFVLQGWAFVGGPSSFWTLERVRSYLAPVPLTKMLVLDLNSDSSPVYQDYQGYFGHYFAYNGLIVFGGRRGVYGRLDALGSAIYAARASYPSLVGVGITPEAIDQALPAFDILLEASWRAAPLGDAGPWLQGYAARRYGASGAPAALVAAAYTLLHNATFRAGGPDLSVYEKLPRLGAAMTRGTNASGALEAARLLLAAAAAMPRAPSTLVYDAMDLVRGAGAALHSDLVSLLSQRYAVGPAAAGGAAPAAAALASLAAAASALLADLDAVLAMDQNFMLGGFVERARALGAAVGAPQLFVRDAKMLVSTWTEDGLAFGGQINDYSSRNGWAGLVGAYYAPRWALFMEVLVNATATGAAPDWAAWRAANAALQARWVNDTATVWPFVPPPGADALGAMRAFLAKWAPAAPAPGNALSAFTAHPGFALAPSGAPPTQDWVFLGANLAAVGSDCPFLQEPKLPTLAACQAGCLADAQCNFVNWDGVDVWCVYRGCVDPLHAALSPTRNYNAYALNRTGASGAVSAVLAQPGAMASVCAADPLCVGFDSLGRIAEGGWGLQRQSGASAWLRAPPPPLRVPVPLAGAAAAACAADTDCSLNGACQAGVCACHPPWQGPSCGQLRFLPIAAPASANGFPGASPPNASTWGGSIVADGAGLFHLFASEMAHNCSLAQWQTNSRCAHAVASDPLGPFVRTDVAVDVWCHLPQATRLAGGGWGGADLWVLWHVGEGVEGAHALNCSASGAPPEGGRDLEEPPRTQAAPPSVLHLANSPWGPWQPVPLASQPQGGNCWTPSQMRHPNGTWYVLCGVADMYSAPNITGPWRWVGTVPTGGTLGTFEDPLLWMDARGNWHAFWHTYTMTCADPQCKPVSISGHSFSADGLQWHTAAVQPYMNLANVSDGSAVWSVEMSTRERPKLLFNASGEPTHLVTAVCPTPSCAPQAAIQCKVQGVGPRQGFWTHTLVVPLDFS